MEYKIKHNNDSKGNYYQFFDYPKRYYYSTLGQRLAYKKAILDRNNYYWKQELENQSNILIIN